MNHRPLPTPLRRGLTLVEAAVAASVAAAAVAAVVPGFEALTARQRLVAAAGLVETTIVHARSLAVARDQVLRLSVENGAGGSCLVLHTGTAAQACRCTVGAVPAAACAGSAQALQVQALPSGRGVALSANVAAMAFEPHRGTVTPAGTLELQSSGRERVRLVVNVMGRVRSCSPDGLPGIAAC